VRSADNAEARLIHRRVLVATAIGAKTGIARSQPRNSVARDAGKLTIAGGAGRIYQP